MNRIDLFEKIKSKDSYLCVGLDTDLEKIPSHLLSEPDPLFAFNRAIIDATADHCIAYKPNLAFYEALGASGWESLRKTIEYIPPTHFTIADAKRGDIGNTSTLYARAFFEQLHVDAITINPYMGEDSVKPFLQFDGKWAILLAHTSNPGSCDFQLTESVVTGKKLYEEVIIKSSQWGTPENLMYVVGATQAEKMKGIRALAPDHFFLVPGVGAQGGDLKMLSTYGFNNLCGLLVNASRSILYASSKKDFAACAEKEAIKIKEEMKECLNAYL